MAGNLSLESAIRTCKIDVGYANKMMSDRFMNPTQMVCPIWSGYDPYGRAVCPDTFNTKTGGCNSAEDRIFVENNNRPKYFEYTTLSTEGVKGDIYDPMSSNTTQNCEMSQAQQDIMGIYNYAGSAGIQYGSVIRSNCGTNGGCGM